MLLLSRILPKRLLRTLLAVRTTRQQAKKSDQFGGVAWAVALIVGVWTYRSEKQQQREEQRLTRTTLRELLDG